MAKKVLQVIDSAYRCNLEEQDDPIVWITAVMKGAGADLHVLLSGNAVNYAVKGQDATGLSFGEKKQTHAPDISGDVEKLATKLDVYVVQDDAADRGLEPTDFVPGVKPVPRSGLPKLFSTFDQVWHW